LNAKKKILLLTPPYPVKERWGKLGIFGGHLPSIGLLYLAAALRTTCEVEIIDAACSDSSKKDILRHILFAVASVGRTEFIQNDGFFTTGGILYLNGPLHDTRV
jgi:hypothetical protein